MHRELGDLKRCLSSLNATLALDPQHQGALQLRATVLYQSGQMSRALMDVQVGRQKLQQGMGWG